jgi:putative hemolysin
MRGMTMGSISALLVIIATMLLTGFFAGSETAVISCSKVRLRHKAERGVKRAHILERLLENPELFFSVVLVGTNISVIVCTAVATALSVKLFGESGVVVATIVMTPLLLIAGEVVPKSAFLYHADRVSLLTAPLLRFFLYLLYPIVAPAMLLTRFLLVVTGSRAKRFNLLNSREELIYLYRRGKEEGLVERRERLIINRVFEFGEVRAKELMIPFERVVSIPVAASIDQVIEEANKHTYSRYPVLSESGGEVVGVISMFDLLGLDGGEKISEVMHEPLFAAEDEPAVKLLVRMKDEALHMAVIVNGAGETEGILTLENILENIVGDIENEYD